MSEISYVYGTESDKYNAYTIYRDGRRLEPQPLAEYIEKLESRIAELETALRWIPVSERLPELDQDVLAIVEGDIVTGHFYQQWDGEIYFSSDDEGAMMVATHWMPLPKFPEVQE